MNRKAVRSIGRIISAMVKEGRKRKAAVFTVEGVAGTPFRSLVFTILSARTKDAATVKAASRLLGKTGTPGKLAAMSEGRIERLIYGVGFHRTKAKHLKEMAGMLLSRFRGKVPSTLEELVLLPGVGRKTANIVLSHSFGKDTIGVDTHVHRISNRLGIVNTKRPEETEKALMKEIPKRYWKRLNLAMVAYGQTLCTPRSPGCGECAVRGLCRRVGVKK